MANRNIGEVVDQMVAIEGLPEGHKNSLEKFANNLRYKAPEQMQEMWGALGSLCSAFVQNKPPQDLVGWEKPLIEKLIDRKL